MSHPITIHSIYTGMPQTMTDERGTWQSTMYRTLVDGPVQVETRGIVNDQCTQPYHHSPDCAICCHGMDHYRFWNEQYDMALQPGNVGENFTLENADEDVICIGDIYQMGSVRLQVSAPRTPCDNQARRIGRADWPKLTIQELRPGFYMRVLTEGTVQAGDEWSLEERLNPDATLTALNCCYYRDFDAGLASRFTEMPGLMNYWQRLFAEKLAKASSA